MVVAFDFDGVLTNEGIQKLARKMRVGNELWVVTMRNNNIFNRGLLKPVLSKIGLTEHQVIFCNDKPKIDYLKGINADIYIDNISDEFEAIRNTTNIIPLLFNN